MDWITDRKIEHVNLCKNNKINPTETYYSEGDGEHTGQWFLERGTLTLSTLERWQRNFEEMSDQLKDKYPLDAEEPKNMEGESALVSWAYMDYKVNPYYKVAPTYAMLPDLTDAEKNGVEIRQNFKGFENIAAHYINEMLHMIWEANIDIADIELPTSADHLTYDTLNNLEFLVQQAYIELASLEPYLYRGTCGELVTWLLNTKTGVLRLEGSGSTYDYDSAASVPWYGHLSKITSVELSGEITSIGSYLFANSQLKEFPTNSTLTTIGSRAFANCSLLEHFSFLYVSSIGESAFENCTSLERLYLGVFSRVIPKNCTLGCTSLKSVGSLYPISKYTIEEGNTPLTSAEYYEGIGATYSWDATYGISNQYIVLNFDFDKAQLYLEYRSGDGYTSDFNDGWNTGIHVSGSENPAPWWRDRAYMSFMRSNPMSIIISKKIKHIGSCVFIAILIKALYISRDLQSVGVRNFPLTTANTAGGLTSDAKIYYEGSEGDRSIISIGSDNSGMVNNTWIYNYGGNE